MRSFFSRTLKLSLLALSVAALFHATSVGDAQGASLQLSWADNSTDETGFNIERKFGVGGTFASITAVGANVTSYTDSSLADGSTYCYRVNAYNSAGNSPYSPEVCGTTAAPPASNYNLTVAVIGAGSVTSNPAGINCGTSCVIGFANATVVTLTAAPASGYTFTGWSGDSDCADGSVTMTAAKACTATFTATPATSTYLLSVSAVGTITTAGTGAGKVVSTPSGIDCGSSCAVSFAAGSVITLTASPNAGSQFTGWSGSTDCLDGQVTMTGNLTCTASFKLISFGVTVTLTGSGSGKVTTTPASIDCGATCSGEFSQNTVVQLIPSANAGSVFSGWSGDADCLDGTVTVDAAKNCTATFTKVTATRLGLYRPSTGGWFLIDNDTGNWIDCNTDLCIPSFGGGANQLPVVGNWNGGGSSKIGVFDAAQYTWVLDRNGDGQSSDCATDSCPALAVPRTADSKELPVIGYWPGLSRDAIGVFQLIPNQTGSAAVRGLKPWSARKGGASVTAQSNLGYWYLDANGNGQWDGCTIDLCYSHLYFGSELPVVGNWSGSSAATIGTFDPQTGVWQVDFNGNGKWDGCQVDRCWGPFGSIGDLPVTGDWTGTGTTKIGVFRGATGEWFLDLNGNGKWDGCATDRCVTGFGQVGDLPVAGKW